jgi:hypothetical protein
MDLVVICSKRGRRLLNLIGALEKLPAKLRLLVAATEVRLIFVS